MKTNAELQKDVQDAIKWEPLLNVAQIGVMVKDGVVTLTVTGTVDNLGVDTPVRTISLYLRRWGCTPQKPVRLAREQNSDAVERWLKTEYLKVAVKAKKEKAEIILGR
jgi:hypothetical protein